MGKQIFHWADQFAFIETRLKAAQHRSRHFILFVTLGWCYHPDVQETVRKAHEARPLRPLCVQHGELAQNTAAYWGVSVSYLVMYMFWLSKWINDADSRLRNFRLSCGFQHWGSSADSMSRKPTLYIYYHKVEELLRPIREMRQFEAMLLFPLYE